MIIDNALNIIEKEYLKEKSNLKCLTCIHSEICIKNNGGANLAIISKDCEHYKDIDEFVKIPCRCEGCEYYNDHRYCTYHESTMFDDDYCSHGNRRS